MQNTEKLCIGVMWGLSNIISHYNKKLQKVKLSTFLYSIYTIYKFIHIQLTYIDDVDFSEFIKFKNVNWKLYC